jgi:hypothetical protein
MFEDDARASDIGTMGRCPRCNRRIWIESGCSPLCSSCDDFSDYDTEREPEPPAAAGDEA